jgi:hypothetical protein
MKIANGMDFINDERVIGKWKYLGYSEDKNIKSTDNLIFENAPYKEIYFLPNGEPYWIFEGWTKGYLTICRGGDAPILTYSYDIYNVDGNDHLFFRKDDRTEVFVKENSEIYDRATLGRHDNIDVDFIDDEKVLGKWHSVGYVENIVDFVPSASKNDFYLKSVEFKPNGQLIQEYMDDTWNDKWTNGLVISLHRSTAAPYIIKTINDREYLFMEWRMGNYIYGGCDPDYYVFGR